MQLCVRQLYLQYRASAEVYLHSRALLTFISAAVHLNDFRNKAKGVAVPNVLKAANVALDLSLISSKFVMTPGLPETNLPSEQTPKP